LADYPHTIDRWGRDIPLSPMALSFADQFISKSQPRIDPRAMRRAGRFAIVLDFSFGKTALVKIEAIDLSSEPDFSLVG
jgi:hypothetical protein